MDLAQVVFRAAFHHSRLFYLQAQLTSTLTGFLWKTCNRPVGLDAERGPHFNQTFAEEGDLLLLVSRRLHLMFQALLLRFEFLNPVVQAVDPFGSLIEELFIEQELGSELVLRRELLL